MRDKINNTTKPKFPSCFIYAFKDAITIANIQGGFQDTDLAPLNAEAVISKLDGRLRTPTPSTTDVAHWVSKTPSNILESRPQSTLIRERIHKHVNSLPTYMFEAVEKLVKGAEMIALSLMLMSDQVIELHTANKAASSRNCVSGNVYRLRRPLRLKRASA